MLVFVVIFSATIIPLAVNASVFSALSPRSAQADTTPVADSNSVSSTTKAPIALVANNIGPSMLGDSAVKASTDVVINNAALTPDIGPVGNAADVADFSGTIGSLNFYTVRAGDTLASVAKMFDITEATIAEANPGLVSGQSLKVGTELVILPQSGHVITLAPGDTVKKIAAKYKVDVNDIYFANDISADTVLSVGDTLIVPDADFTTKSTAGTTKNSSSSTRGGSVKLDFTSPNPIGDLLIRPVAGLRTQGFHPTGAVDIGIQVGTPVKAAYRGTIIRAKSSGWNGGFGKFVSIAHVINGVSVVTNYGHLSRVDVAPGQTVDGGEIIGLSGSTGNSTGPHLHWEVRSPDKSVRNPVAINKYFGL